MFRRFVLVAAAVCALAVVSACAPPAPAPPPAAPAAPPSLSAAPGDGRVSLSWPAASGAVSTYRVFIDGAHATDTSARTFSRTGLVNGRSYSFSVAAVGPGGSSAKRSVSAMPFTVPSAPSSVALSASNGALSATWQAPSSTGGRPVTGYSVDVSAGGTVIASLNSPVRHVDVTGLVNGVEYLVSVRAINAAGSGATGSAVGSPAPRLPSAPQALVSSVGAGEVSLSWSAPSDAGDSEVSGFEVRRDGELAGSVPAGSLTFTDVGLVAGVEYSYSVRALSEFGASPWAVVSAVPFAVGDEPVDVAVAPGGVVGSVYVSWSAPQNPGVDGFEVVAAGAAQSVAVGSDVSGVRLDGFVPNAGVEVRVVARRGVLSAPSDPAAGRAAALPSVPRDVQVSPGDGSLAVSWSPPEVLGSVSPMSFVVLLDGFPSAVSSPGASSLLIDGLVNGVPHSVSVVARTDLGDSPASPAVLALVHTVPSAPALLSAPVVGASVRLLWAFPASSGGSPVVAFDVFRDGVLVGSTAAHVVSFVDEEAGPGSFAYTVAARNAAGPSLPSNAVGAVVP